MTGPGIAALESRMPASRPWSRATSTHSPLLMLWLLFFHGDCGGSMDLMKPLPKKGRWEQAVHFQVSLATLAMSSTEESGLRADLTRRSKEAANRKALTSSSSYTDPPICST